MEGVSLSAAPAINGGRALSPPYIIPSLHLLLHQGVVGGGWQGAVSVIFTGVQSLHLAPTTYLSWKPIKQSKHYPNCNRALHHTVTECVISSSIRQPFENHVNGSIQHHDVISSLIRETETNRQPTRSVNSGCQIGGVCFLHLGGG